MECMPQIRSGAHAALLLNLFRPDRPQQGARTGPGASIGDTGLLLPMDRDELGVSV